MSYQEELLIRIRSAYESGGFSSLSADLSKAKAGYNQVTAASKGDMGAIGLNSTSNAASQAATKLSQVSTAGSKMGSTVAKAGETGAKGLNSISTAGTGVVNTMDGISSVLTGVMGGFGLMTIAQSMWTGSTTKQFNSAYLQTKMSSDAASSYISQIQQIVAEVPGDDTFMNNLMTGAVAKQTNLSTTELRALGIASADYLTTSQAMGKSALETQMDLKEYILTGNTTQLERDSILKQQMSTLEGQGTVSERILALNKALQAEGYAGLSQLDIASIKAEELKGKFQLAATTLGDKVLPYVEKFVDFMLDLDQKTGGVSSEILIIAGGAVAATTALGLIGAPIKSALGDAKDLVGWIKDKIPSTKTTTVKCVKDPSCSGSDSTTTSTKTTLSSLKGELAAIFAGTSGGAALSGAAIAVTFVLGIVGTLANYGLGYYIQSWLNAQDIKNPFEKLGIDAGMALLGGLLPGLSNAFRQGSAQAGNSFLHLLDGFDLTKMAQDRINQDLGNLKIQLGGVLDWGNWVKAPGQIMEIVSWLNKVICAIRGCSPGIIPSLQAMQIVFMQVFNAVKAPVMVVWNLIMLFANFVMTEIRVMGNTVIMIWNTVTGTVSVWISTGVNVATGAINWAVGVWNWATGTISVWVGTGINVATNAIDTAWAYWQRLKDFVKDPIQGVINIVTQAASAGSPTEIDYLYGQGSYFESDYTPISTTSSVTSVAAVTSTSTINKIVISEGAVKVEVGSIDSEERVKEVENAITVALSDLNDSKGN